MRPHDPHSHPLQHSALEHVCTGLNLGLPARPVFRFKLLAGVEAGSDGQAILE